MKNLFVTILAVASLLFAGGAEAKNSTYCGFASYGIGYVGLRSNVDPSITYILISAKPLPQLEAGNLYCASGFLANSSVGRGHTYTQLIVKEISPSR